MLVTCHLSLVTVLHHSTAIVTVLLMTPSAVMLRGTAEPGAVVIGISALICHRPTQPGAMPLKETRAVCPPMVTVGCTRVVRYFSRL